MPIRIPPPELQIEFSVALAETRRLYLVEALADTVRTIKVAELDKEIGQLVPADALAKMAGHGLRAELILPVPMILRANPHLLGTIVCYTDSVRIFSTLARLASARLRRWKRAACCQRLSSRILKGCARRSLAAALCCWTASARPASVVSYWMT